MRLAMNSVWSTRASRVSRIAPNAKRYAEYLERAYQIADRNLKKIIDAAKLWQTNIIAVSDHGMAPMHTVAFPNRILRAAELVSVTSTGAVDPATSMTNAVTE